MGDLGGAGVYSAAGEARRVGAWGVVGRVSAGTVLQIRDAATKTTGRGRGRRGGSEAGRADQADAARTRIATESKVQHESKFPFAGL